MSEREPNGPYIYQPFGPVSHPDRKATGRFYGVGGVSMQATIQGLTKREAERIVEVLDRLSDPKREGTGDGD